MPMLPVRLTGPTNQTPVEGGDNRAQVLARIEQQQQPQPPRSLGQRILGASGLARVSLGFMSLGITELVRFIQGYQTSGTGGAEPRALANQQIQRENRQLLQKIHDSVVTGQFQYPLQNAVNAAIEKTKTDLQSITRVDPQNVLGSSILNLQSKPRAFDEPIKEKSLISALTKELKEELLLQEADSRLRHTLGQRGPWGYGTERTGLMAEMASTIRGLGSYPPGQISGELDRLVLQMTDKGENLHNAKEARKSALNTYAKTVMDKFGTTHSQVTSNPEYKNLMQLLDETAGLHERQEAARNGGRIPLIPRNSYEELLQKQVQNFLKDLGIR